MTDEGARSKRWKMKRAQLQTRAHEKLPWLFPHPLSKETLRWYWARDEEQNQKSTPTKNETVDLVGLWAVEFYTPSHSKNLLATLTNRVTDSSGLAGRHTPASWLQDSRSGQRGLGWMNVGPIARPGQKTRLGPALSAELPAQVEEATAYLFSLSPSVTCLVVNFIYSKASRRTLDQALRDHYKTRLERKGRGFSIWSSWDQKRERIKAIRK